MNKKKNKCSLLVVALATLLSIGFTACDGDRDDGLEKTDIISEKDPEGTIVINMRNGKSSNWYDIGITSIHINEANNFSGAEFLSVGKVNGLSEVNSIPSIGWTETIAVVPETGYIVRSNRKYARLYVVDYIISTEGGIIGATVKYQSPFIDDIGDYHIQYEVVNLGTLSDEDAKMVIDWLISDLNPQTGNLQDYTKDEAICVFDSVIENLRTNFAGVNEFEFSFRVKLMTGQTTVKSKVINIKIIGCTVD